jgi:D-glycero-D-manno-heptose 1,7-bisphosphate phosphatase
MKDASRKAVFLDRDGTIIEEVNFLSEPDQVKLFTGTFDALRKLREEGFLVIVVTNQSGVGRGLFSEENVHAVHARIQELTGDAIDAFYFCPHLPDGGCECRKPGDGMMRQAAMDFGIDFACSWIVGDKLLDVRAGNFAGIRSILVKTGYGRAHEIEAGESAVFIADEILSATEFILANKDQAA